MKMNKNLGYSVGRKVRDYKMKRYNHKWKPVNGFMAYGKVFIIEHCKKTGLYRYVRVPSNTKLALMEGG